MSALDLVATAVLAAGVVGLHQAAWHIVRRKRLLAGRSGKSRRTSLAPAATVAAAMLVVLTALSIMVWSSEGATTAVDRAIVGALEPLRYPALVALFSWLTLLGNTESLVAIFVAATITLLAFGRRSAVATLWAVWLGAYGTTFVLKQLIDRPRPKFILDVVAYSPSFPSGHATGSLALFGILGYLAVRYRADVRWRFEVIFWSVVLIALVSFSRLYVAVHHPTDVVGGIMVGGIWLIAGIAVAERMREQQRKCPDPSEPP